MKKVKILGVDPGSRSWGYAFYDGEKVLISGEGKLSASADFPSRLLTIETDLTLLVKENKPNLLALEGGFYGINANTAARLDQVRGVIMLVGARFGLRVLEYKPAQVKKASTGNGKAKKQQVQEAVLKKFGITAKADEADAIAVCLTAFSLEVGK